VICVSECHSVLEVLAAMYRGIDQGSDPTPGEELVLLLATGESHHVT
jgi:hypothetical protein